MSKTTPNVPSRLLRLLLGAALGSVIHLFVVGGTLSLAVWVNLVVGPPNATAEGVFWAQLIAFLSCPAGAFTGAITGFVGSSGDRTWFQTARIGAAAAALTTFITYGLMRLSINHNLVIPGLVLAAGLFTAALVARMKSAKRTG